ncbi:hypothetical protein BGZ99_007775 [Dissophora globulifera]|uniref:Uncharacterized protein n=1 Tax=Dissophora globulifera TaxID=979702 RepID=A0A9P6R8K0_9FUNG|nr:hypothetical protein BGZ99_007775 [Dissophora globulifera]
MAESKAELDELNYNDELKNNPTSSGAPAGTSSGEKSEVVTATSPSSSNSSDIVSENDADSKGKKAKKSKKTKKGGKDNVAEDEAAGAEPPAEKQAVSYLSLYRFASKLDVFYIM